MRGHERSAEGASQTGRVPWLRRILAPTRAGSAQVPAVLATDAASGPTRSERSRRSGEMTELEERITKLEAAVANLRDTVDWIQDAYQRRKESYER